jgi:tetratricopeptide (TPR) repeat protein
MQLSRCSFLVVLGLFLASFVAVGQESPDPERPEPAPDKVEPTSVDPLATDPLADDPTQAEADPAEELPPGADLSEARELVRAGDFARAELVLAEQREEFPDDPRLLLLQGEVLLALSQPARALPLLQEAAELDGDRPRVHFQLATALQATGDREGALEAFAKEIDINEDTQVRVMARLNRMILLEQEGELAEAAAELEAVVELDSTQIQAYGEMARFYIQAGELDAAAGSLETGLEQGFASAEHFYSLGAQYLGKKTFDAAIRAFRQALEIDPELAPAERSLAYALDQTDREQEALEHFRRYLELRPDAPDAAQVSQRIEAIQGN